MHPCLHDYDAFWPVHDHLKQHLKSTKDKYNYIDPGLEALYEAEEAAKEMDDEQPRKKQRTAGKGRQHDTPRPPLRSLSPPVPVNCTVEVNQRPSLPRQPELQRGGQLQLRTHLNSPPQADFQPSPRPRISPSQSLSSAQPSHAGTQPAHKRFEIEMGTSQAGDRWFLMTLRSSLDAKGHLLRHVSTLQQSTSCISLHFC